jgi:hypothetical protein
LKNAVIAVMTTTGESLEFAVIAVIAVIGGPLAPFLAFLVIVRPRFVVLSEVAPFVVT